MVMVAAVEHVALLLSYWRGTRHKGGPSPRGGGCGRFTPRRWIDLDRIGDGVVLSSSSSAVCRGVDQAVHFGGYGYPPWLYFEIRHQKWFTVEAVAVLQGVGRREATTAEL